MKAAYLKDENGGLNMYKTPLGEHAGWLAPGVRFYLTGEEHKTKTCLWARGFYYDNQHTVMGWVAKRYLKIDDDPEILSEVKSPPIWGDVARYLLVVLGILLFVVFIIKVI